MFSGPSNPAITSSPYSLLLVRMVSILRMRQIMDEVYIILRFLVTFPIYNLSDLCVWIFDTNVFVYFTLTGGWVARCLRDASLHPNSAVQTPQPSSTSTPRGVAQGIQLSRSFGSPLACMIYQFDASTVDFIQKTLYFRYSFLLK